MERCCGRHLKGSAGPSAIQEHGANLPPSRVQFRYFSLLAAVHLFRELSHFYHTEGFWSDFASPRNVWKLFIRKWLRGRDLNPRPLGYERNLMLARPFCSIV